MAMAIKAPRVEAAAVHPWVAAGAGSVQFSVVGGPVGDWPRLGKHVQRAEEIGLDSYWCPDHPLLLPDCWTTVAAVAASTSRLRLGSLVAYIDYRNPVGLARSVADVDRMSSGRAVLGLGAEMLREQAERVAPVVVRPGVGVSSLGHAAMSGGAG
jgi:alkanesulfonate monooxygenase SsuD/methylene tetrahydromethanopterin reductase-like flavin-dependent oxidoreductase (luciferase family)